MNKIRGSVHMGSEKLYTQKEVDNLLEEGKEKDSDKLSLTKEKKRIKNQKIIDNNTVKGLVKQSNRILVSVSSHALPFDLFPNTINVEDTRITVINRHFLSSAVHSVDIKNISNILINTSILFSQLVIVSKTFEENEIKIRNLWIKDAVMIRRIIEGLRLFEEKQIDTSVYTKKELLAKLKELSTTEIVM